MKFISQISIYLCLHNKLSPNFILLPSSLFDTFLNHSGCVV